MRYFLFFFLFTCITISNVKAQRVPEELLNSIISEYTTDGYTLEQVFKPDFSLQHPNVNSRLLPCYIGKVATVLVVMAKKPVSLSFQLKSLGKPGKTEPIQSFVFKGKTYWMDYRVMAFTKDMTDKSNHCLFIQACDTADFTLPIYTIILTSSL